MSRIQVTVSICDRCGIKSLDQDGVKFYSFEISGVHDGEYDLCEGCFPMLSDVLGLGGEAPRPKTRRGSTVAADRARKEWSEEEDNFVLDNDTMDVSEVANHLGRSRKAVQLRRNRLERRRQQEIEEARAELKNVTE